MNGDGALDLVVFNERVAQGVFVSAINVILAGADGFEPGVQYLMGETSGAFDLGDLNGDGFLDVVTCETSPDTLSVRLGNGDGTLGLRQTFASAFHPMFLLLIDHTGDGVLDALSGTSLGTAAFYLFPGDGAGGFLAPQTQALADPVDSITPADLDGDGVLDLVATGGESRVRLFLGLADGGFALAGNLTEAPNSTGAVITDLDRDGKQDLVVTTQSADQIYVHLGLGGAAFAAPTLYPTGLFDLGGVAADFDHDGAPDLAIPAPFRNNVRVLLNETMIAPKPFALLAPADGTEGLALPEIVAGWFTPALRWQSAAAGASYHVQLATDEAFEDIVLEFVDVDATNVEVPAGALLPDTQYFWRVTATTSSGETQSVPFPATFMTARLADLNGDGVVDSLDLAALLAGWGD